MSARRSAAPSEVFDLGAGEEPVSDRDREPAEGAARKPGLSLKGRALRHLATREHSRVELERKLAPHAEAAEQLARVLDELEASGWLSAERFVASVSYRKASRYGLARIKAELRQHRIPDEVAATVLDELRGTELARAHALWSRRFDALPAAPEDRARQSRFLAQRGFSGGVIQQVLQGWVPDES